MRGQYQTQHAEFHHVREQLTDNEVMDLYYADPWRLIEGGTDAVDELLAEKGVRDPEKREKLLAAATTASKMATVLRPHFVGGQRAPKLEQLRADGALKEADGPEWLWSSAHSYLKSRNRGQHRDYDTLIRATHAREYSGPTRQDHKYELERELRRINQEMAVLGVEEERQGQALDELQVPAEVTQGVSVLVYFAVAGILFPLIVQAVGVESVVWWLRLLLVAAFASGLGLLLWFIWHVAHSVAIAGGGDMVEHDEPGD